MRIRHVIASCALLATLACGESGDVEGSTDAADTTSGATSSGSSSSAVTTVSTSSDPDATSGAPPTTTTSTDEDSSGGDASTGGDAPGVRYDGVQQKSAHNSYQRDESIFDQLVYHRVRSIELDIHVGKTFEPTEPGVWYVYHTDVTDDDTWCVRLGHCLDAVASFTTAIDAHEIVTLWVDLKDPWDDEHGPAELDAALESTFGDALVDGEQLLTLAGCADGPSVQAGLVDPACGWPTLGALRGRVLVVLTGGSGALRDYHDGEGRRALVAPALADPDDASDWPNTAIFNFAAADVDAAAAFVEAGFVARVWDCNDEASWTAARGAGAHHIATDKVSVHEDPWARTHDDEGWPFACKDVCEDPALPAEGAILGLQVDSGDVWASSDSAWFVHDDRSASPDGTWQAFVSTPNSHVEPFAKACLMARASLDPAAPYFAVCRPADQEPLRVQWRATQGGSSVATEHAISPDNTLDGPGAAFVRLRLGDAGTCITGEGSADGTTWIPIDDHCFDAPLVLQGITASSHDSGVVRLLVGNVTLDGAAPRSLGDFTAQVALGAASADAFDGVMP